MDFRDEWFNDEDFWKEFAPFIFDGARWAEAPAVASGVVKLLGLKSSGEGGADSRILDLCCGPGRVSLELARRGFAVTGVDLSRAYLEAAKDDAAIEGLELECVRADSRAFTRPGFFDAAVNLYTSFGYFENEADDLRAARNVYESLKAGGAFIIDILGKEIAVRDFVQSEWSEREGCKVLCRSTPVDSWTRLENRWLIIGAAEREKAARQFEKTFTQRLYAASELRALLQKAGFSRLELYGDWDKSPYDYQAQRLIALGWKD
jgi:SAM-dependent methyltransferase